MSRTKISPGKSAADQLAKDLGKEKPKFAPRVDPQTAQRLTIAHDIVNEQVLIAAAIADPASLKHLTGRAKPDDFFGKGHAPIWAALTEVSRKGLAYSPAVTSQLSGGKVDEDYLRQLQKLYQQVPPNIGHHLSTLSFDRQRIEVARGPLPELLKAMQDTSAGPDVLRAATKKLAVAFDGYGDRRHLLDPNELVRQQSDEIMKRRQGHAVYPYGIDGLDVDNNTNAYRMIPGAAPGLITCVTGVSGGGKSSFVARMALGLIELGRRVLFGSWEVKGGMTLELLAVMKLGISRTRSMTGALTDEEHQQIYDAMLEIGGMVRFLEMPFGRARGVKVDNDRNLDIIHGYIADSGCDVAIFDLWKRCLRFTDPDDEEQALIRQQAIAQETNVHCVLVQQQRLKDIEQRKDKRPTRDGIKGSGAWIEVPDTIIAPHRPALFKRVDDDTLEIIVLKQRWGKWPMAVAFDWNAELGSVAGGRTIDYDLFDESSERGDEGLMRFTPTKGKK